MVIHGYPDEAWNRAREETRGVLIRLAAARQTIAYSDLALEIARLDHYGFWMNTCKSSLLGNSLELSLKPEFFKFIPSSDRKSVV